MPNLPSEPRSDALPPALWPLALRGAFGGVLMGLANLVPGISGGTLLLATGVYPRFIQAVGEVTTFHFRKASLVTLAAVGLAAAAAIGSLAGVVKDLVVGHRWIMYSLFIGLTLGGVPVLWRLIRRPSRAVGWGAAAGFVGMALVAFAQAEGAAGVGAREGVGWMLLAGVAGASAMILPGISGGYLLLLLGAYVPLLAAISKFVGALGARDLATAASVGAAVLLPVGVGVVAGIVGVSNLLRWLLARFEKATYGVLLGLLLGAVLGLWPFQQGVAPEPGAEIKGREVSRDDAGAPVYAGSGKPVDRDDYPTAYFTPTAGQVGASMLLVVGAFFLTGLVDRLGREPQPPPSPRGNPDGQRGVESSSPNSSQRRAGFSGVPPRDSTDSRTRSSPRL
jgi:putative membrane protein